MRLHLRNVRDLLHLPKVVTLSLLLALMLTFTACGGGDGDVELDEDGIEEGIGGEEADD